MTPVRGYSYTTSIPESASTGSFWIVQVPDDAVQITADTITINLQNVPVVDRAYGIFMQSYFGGRAECRIRNWEVPVGLVDFMSQYPTVNELLGNCNVLTAKGVSFPGATKEVRRVLSTITLEHCFKRKLWSQFRFVALVRPDNDILPVRTIYNGTTQNIGINYLTSKEPIWFADPTSLRPFS